MRKIILGLVLFSLAHRAVAAEVPLIPQPNAKTAERLRTTGKALVGSGLALIGTALVLVLSLTLSDLDHKNGGTLSAMVAGPVIGGVGLALTTSGAPLWALSEPATTPWQRARRLRAGRGLVGAGVAAQLIAIGMGTVGAMRAFDDAPEVYDSASTKALIGTSAGLGIAGLAMMCAGISVIATSHQDAAGQPLVSFGPTSLRLTF